MFTKDQNYFDQFKILLNETILTEEFKIKHLKIANGLLNDNDLEKYFKRRQDFLNFCTGCKNNIQNITQYISNEKLIDNIQKDFYLNIDNLKKEGLKLIAKNQKPWFEKLYKDNFEILKSLLKSLLIYETPRDTVTMERIIQEIELLRVKSGY